MAQAVKHFLLKARSNSELLQLRFVVYGMDHMPLPSPHTHLSPPREVWDSTDQAAHHHTHAVHERPALHQPNFVSENSETTATQQCGAH
jgi:hypothetical protein